jgi:hypothetical protein
MNFSPWSDAVVGKLRISNRVGIDIGTGVQLRQTGPPAFGWGRLGRVGETLVEPVGQIDIKAELRLGATHPSISGNIEIGFIQTMVRCLREARYGPSPHATVDTFSRTHPAYPVKDGEGQPWYNDGNAHSPNAVLRMSSTPLGKYVSDSNKSISPFVAVYDKPKFGFPASIGGNLVQSVNVEDTFLTCLAVKSNGNFFALHSVLWKMRASQTGQTGQTKPTGTISVVGSGPIPPPYALPPNLVLQGTSANRSEQMLCNGARI